MMDNRNEEDSLNRDAGNGKNRKQAKRKMKGVIPDLSSLYETESNDEIESEAARPTSARQKSSQKSDRAVDEVLQEASLPPGLDYYLPPEIMRKIKGDNPGKGALLNALDRLRSLLYVLSTFLPGHLVQEKMQNPVAGEIKCDVLRGTLLFSDVSGFTALSERLSFLGLEGAEKLTAIMNQYFGTMLEILSWSGGILIKFAGDATLVYFPEQENGEQVRWAVRAGFRMFRAMKEFEDIDTPQGNVTLKMKIGIGTGEYMASSVGTRTRMEYVVFGESVHDTMESESVSTGAGQLIVNQASIQHLDDGFEIHPHTDGYYRVEVVEQTLDDFEIKAERRRARGMIPLDATPKTIIKEMSAVLSQIEAIAPYLAGELINRLVVQGRKRRIESEFRPTTVLFCNFIGLDELIRHWKDEQGKKRICSILNTYFQSMNEEITRFGGIVSRIDPYKDGLKMLVLFGAPVAHEDDTQRAVSASLAMNEKLQLLNTYWEKKFKRYLSDISTTAVINHRIGITNGGTFAGQVGSSTRCEYTVMGDDVNLAARLMGAADMGQILISENVYAVVSDYFLFSQLPAISVKGKSNPISIYQVDGSREDTLINRANRRSFISGREIELQNTKKILEKVFKGSAEEIIILGPAGIGKSHLADFLLKYAMEFGATVIPVQCRPYTANTSYHCWRTFLKSWVGIIATDTVDVQQNKLSQALCDTKISFQDAALLAELLNIRFEPVEDSSQADEYGEDNKTGQKVNLSRSLSIGKWRRRGSSLDILDQLQTENEQMYISVSGVKHNFSSREKEIYKRVFLSFIQSITNKKPLVVFFEDAHWIDQETNDIIGYLCNALDKSPCLFLSARREIGEGIHDGQYMIKLEPLDLMGTADLISQILVSDLAPLVLQQSNGNPLFIEQITLWLKRTRKIGPSELQSVLKSSNILQELVLSSIESLPEMEQDIIKTASIIGNEFRYSEIQCLLPETVEPATLSAYLRHLIESQLLTLNDASVDTLYGYQQTLVKDVLYNSIPFERRRELHFNLAEYLAADHSERRKLQNKILAFLDDPDDTQREKQDNEKIAVHYELAQNYAKAAKFFIEAGSNARYNQEIAKAQECFMNASMNLERIEAGSRNKDISDMRNRAETGQADLMFLNGEYSGASVIYTRQLEQEHIEQRVMITGKLALIYVLLGQEGDACQLMERIFENDDLQSDTIFPLAVMAWLYWRKNNENMDRFAVILNDILMKSIPDNWSAGINAFMLELRGEWEKAFQQYRILGLNDICVLTAISAGNYELMQENADKAMVWFEKANEVIDDTAISEAEICALLHYHVAKSYHVLNDEQSSIENLQKARGFLKQTVSKKLSSVNSKLKNFINAVEKRQEIEFPLWNWQEIDDKAKISLLFPP